MLYNISNIARENTHALLLLEILPFYVLHFILFSWKYSQVWKFFQIFSDFSHKKGGVLKTRGLVLKKWRGVSLTNTK